MSTRLVSLATASLLSIPALAQTTWTSFEDRKGHAIASDPAGGVLMFGGESSTSAGELLADTSAFTNPGATATWTQLNPFSHPSARTEHAMASGVSTDDAAIFILFGGLAIPNTGGPAIPTNETFVYDGSGWGNTNQAQLAPSARTGHTMLTDPIRNKVVLFGGLSGGFARNDVWEFDPVSMVWAEIVPNATPGSPPPRYDHAMAFHPGFGGTTSRVYLFGGTGFKFDMWELDPWQSPPTWTNVTPAVRPSGRRRAAMAFLPAFDNIVMFGGENNTLTPLNDTWVWDRYGGTTGTWTQSGPTTSPPARFDHAIAPDQLGNNVVLLGGDDGSGTALAGTWLWNGVGWSEQLPPPSPRTGVAMAYDSNRDMHPLFGGRAIPGGADLGETWELDGLNWRPRSPSNAPSARADAGICYDSARNRTVLYGGRTGGACATELGDTWEWDGQNWSPRVLANNPPAAGGVQPVFDTVRDVTWMLVGSEMWSYDGTDWMPPPAVPEGTGSFGFAYDTVRGRLVAFGDISRPSAVTNETWEWDGTRWYEMSPATNPPGRGEPGMDFDAARGECILYSGRVGATRFADSWTWNGVDWQLQSSPPGGGRSANALAYDVSRMSTVMFGGSLATAIVLDETYEWDGATWAGVSPLNRPPARHGHAMAYDPAANVVVLVSGTSAPPSDLQDMWTFDGADWTQLTPATLPPGRNQGRLAHHAQTGEMVLFGGYSYGQTAFLDDTWTWNGTAWTQENPNNKPSPRYGPALFSTASQTLLWGGFEYDTATMMGVPAPPVMFQWDGQDWVVVDSGKPPARTNYGAAYDVRRDRVVVFGGRENCAAGNYLNETWEWDGDSWLQSFPANVPSPRERSQLTFDQSRGRIVLFGGTDGTNTFNDTWEWDGSDWIARLPVSSPPGSSGHGLTFDQQRRVTVAFGSSGTWDYGPEFPANIETYGSGCAGPNGVPSLSPKPWAGPWLGGRLEVDLVNPPSTGLGIFVWGFSETIWSGLPLPLDLAAFGSPGCSLYAAADLTQLFLAGVNPYVSFVLPTDTSILGARMRAQAGFLPIGSSPVVSNALRMTFGSK